MAKDVTIEKTWNQRHNGAKDSKHRHGFTNNWQTIAIPIKVHPSDDKCNTRGLQCQYLKQSLDGTYNCAWNFEYRGNDYYSKGPLKPIEEGSPFMRKATFCMNRRSVYSYNGHDDTFENTKIHIEIPEQEDANKEEDETNK